MTAASPVPGMCSSQDLGTGSDNCRHGACFNTETGDIENAPALDPINTFPVTVKDDGIYITAEEAPLKAGSRVPNIACTPSSDVHVLIVGGGSGTLGAIEGLREKGFKGKVTVLTKEAYLPIDRTKLSKALLTEKSKLQWRDAAHFEKAGVEFHLSTEVESVDLAAHSVKTKDGKEWKYSKVIFATGGTPRRLPMPGFKELGNIFTLRTIGDAEAILSAAGDKDIVVIGSSFIGLEVGKCLAGKNNNVTIVGMESAPLERIMGAKVGAIFKRQLEQAGVKFRLSASVDDAKPSSSDPSKVGSVLLKSGESLPADLVVLGVGVAPATEYLKGTGIELAEDGSVHVDDHWRIKGVEDAYAVGDIATYPYAYGDGPVRIEHWNVAQNAGRQAVLHIAIRGKPTPFIPVFWSALGAQLRYCGYTASFDDVVILGDTEKNKWTAYYTVGDKVVAVASQGTDPVVMQSAELMRRKKMLSKTEVLAGKSVLDVYVPAGVRVEVGFE